jgi:proline racemase
MKWERTITVIGCHVGGEDNHVIVGGRAAAARRHDVRQEALLETQADELRRWLLLEPRGKPTPTA